MSSPVSFNPKELNLNLPDSQPLSHFHELPMDTIFKVFFQLSIRDLGTIGCICRKFSLIEKNPLIWQPHALRLALFKDGKSFYEEHKFDFESTKPIKEQIKEIKISFTEM